MAQYSIAPARALNGRIIRWTPTGPASEPQSIHQSPAWTNANSNGPSADTLHFDRVSARTGSSEITVISVLLRITNKRETGPVVRVFVFGRLSQ